MPVLRLDIGRRPTLVACVDPESLARLFHGDERHAPAQVGEREKRCLHGAAQRRNKDKLWPDRGSPAPLSLALLPALVRQRWVNHFRESVWVISALFTFLVFEADAQRFQVVGHQIVEGLTMSL
eukprot:CAMPEP_0181228366 /NCGR_PEP_ID=MMETSP1096-20121128/33308_1 /TAXON_ID=156174 ORGANISM="Chrysochromulina ericina, Strain CCMP281" /NCGR_SAMPLE_ID=MMETSP1096 /ASSEMBLY_ACC=CAM_ASM_000453 /LENGTH=123 /DNA_ID=CAMNT_0023321883 /DNA_START=538 /DNA_END=909 /DNA_ORIENTATION=+